MPQQLTFSIPVGLLALENHQVFAKPIRWSELQVFDGSWRHALMTIEVRAEPLVKSGFPRFFSPVKSIDPNNFSRRHLPDALETIRIEILFEPSPDNRNWIKPVRVPFDAVFWPLPNGWNVHVPVLNLEMFVAERKEIAQKLEARIRELMAVRFGNKLGWEQFVAYCRVRAFRCERVSVTAEMPTRVETDRLEYSDEAQSEKTDAWDKLGAVILRRHTQDKAFGVDGHVKRLADEFVSTQSRQVLLVGPSGVGKTAIWHEFVRRAREFGVQGGVFTEVEPATLAASSSDCCGGWQSKCDTLIKQAERDRAIVHLGNLWELCQVGMAEGQPQNIGSYLISASRGKMPIVCECTSEQLAVIEQEQPGLFFEMTRIDIDEPDQKTAVNIYRSVAETLAPNCMTESAIIKMDALHRRYATYSASPGRSLRFLKNLVAEDDATNRENRIVTEQDVTAAFSHETGLPLLLLEESLPLDMATTRQWFAERIIGQNDAASVIINLLMTYKAKLSRPDRPIASLLFVGPTGVGKTEMAKALAEFLYQDQKRMIRIDMNEYAEYGAAERLIRGTARGEGVLTAKVRQQPFAVVLLDEFEKAHANVFDLLLQVLGEGRLTDAAGRVADFRNCVILMTSNLGVEKFGLPKSGFETSISAADVAHAVSHFTAEASRILRPEMLNRIDRVVPFLPLDRGSLLKILGIEFRKIEKRYGLASRPISIDIDNAVHEKLIALGYDPRFGARSLRRMVEREFLLPLGKTLRKYQTRMPLAIRASIENDEIKITATPTSNFTMAISQNTSSMTMLSQIGQLRQYSRRLLEHSVIAEMKARINRAVSLRRKYRKLIRKEHSLPNEVRRFLTNVDLADQPYVEEANRLYERAVRTEEEALLLFYNEQLPITNLVELKKLFDDFVLRLYQEIYGKTDHVLLAVYGKNVATVHETINIYKRITEQLGFRWSWYALEPYFPLMREGTLEPNDRLLGKPPSQIAARHLDQSTPLTLPHVGQLGQLLVIKGKMAKHYFGDESGLVKFYENRNTKKTTFECSVLVSAELLDDFFPPMDLHGNIDVSYDRISRQFDVGLLGDSLIDTMAESFRATFEHKIMMWVAE